MINPSKHFAHIGDYSEALDFFKRSGGMLFPPRSNDHQTVILVGKSVHTFYPPDSTSRQQCQRLAREFELPDELVEHATAGRLAKWYIDNILRLPHHKTYYSKDYVKLARDGYHWHYLYAKPGKYPYAFEWDLKSAYATAWVNRPTLLYHPNYGWLRDDGAVKRLKADLYYLPKWFRLTLLGVIASHSLTFYTKDKNSMEFKLKKGQANKIPYGAAFNAAHVAVWKVWNVMKEAHDILGHHCLRAHTDGMVTSYDCFSDELDYDVVELIESKGFEFGIKASGPAYIEDVGTGIVGAKVFGNKKEVLKAAYVEGVDLRLEPITHLGLGQFGRKAAKIAGLIKPNDLE